MKIKFYRVVVPIPGLLIFIFLLAGCRHESPTPEVTPLLKTNQIAIIKGVDGGITLSGEFILSGKYASIQYGFSIDSVIDFKNAIVFPAGTNSSPGKFSVTAQIALRSGVSYYLRTWATTSKYQVFGNTIVFQTNGTADPIIEKIEPANALWGDTIRITGKNFDYFGKNNIVRFNGVAAVKTWGSRDTIMAVVPFSPTIQNYTLTVTVAVYNNISKDGFPFRILSPVITGISATEGQYPDTITVTGDNFSRTGTQLLVNGVADSVIALNKKSFSFVVPFLKVDQVTKIEFHDPNKNYTVAENFHYHGQQINLLQKEAWIGDTIKLYGTNLDFRRVMLDIENIDNGYILYGGPTLPVVQKWKDSLSFVLNGSYPASAFNVDILFGNKLPEGRFIPSFSADRIVINHRVPVILSCEKVVAYRQNVYMNTRGTYIQAGQQGVIVTSLDGSVRLSFEGAGGGVPGNYQILPGDYKVQVYSFDRYSTPAYFTVKAPLITNIYGGVLNRDNLLHVTGNYLPAYTNYQITHVQSGRVFSITSGTYPDDSGMVTTQDVDLRSIFGSGDYQLQINIPGNSFKYPATFAFQDYFTYSNKLLTPLPLASSVGCGFAVNNKLYIPQNGGMMSIIDLGSRSVSSKEGEYNYDHQPVFLDNKIYMNVQKGSTFVLSSFNETTEDWDAIDLNGLPVGSSLGGLGVFNNHLIVMCNGGDFYQYDQKWTFLSHPQLDLYFVHYIHQGNGVLYFCDFYKGIISVVSTADWKIIRDIQIPVLYQNSLRYIFELNNELYFFGDPVGAGLETFYKFTTSETFEKLNPFQFNYDFYYHFCPDGKGNVFFINQDYIYKFNP